MSILELSGLSEVWESALRQYADLAGVDLREDELAELVGDCNTDEDIVRALECEMENFKEFRNGSEKWRKVRVTLKRVVGVVLMLNDSLGEAVSSVSRFYLLFVYTRFITLSPASPLWSSTSHRHWCTSHCAPIRFVYESTLADLISRLPKGLARSLTPWKSYLISFLSFLTVSHYVRTLSSQHRARL